MSTPESESEWEREQRFWREHPIDRFDLEECGSSYLSYRDMQPSETGDWISAEDHRKAIEGMAASAAAANALLKEAHDVGVRPVLRQAIRTHLDGTTVAALYHERGCPAGRAAAPSLGHPGADEVLDRLQTGRKKDAKQRIMLDPGGADDWGQYAPNHRCTVCGCTKDHHRSGSSTEPHVKRHLCPPTISRGVPKSYDGGIEDYWTVATVFTPEGS